VGGGLPTALWIRRVLNDEDCARSCYAMLSPQQHLLARWPASEPGIKFIASIRGVPELSGLLRRGTRWVVRATPTRLIAEFAVRGADWATSVYGRRAFHASP